MEFGKVSTDVLCDLMCGGPEEPTVDFVSFQSEQERVSMFREVSLNKGIIDEDTFKYIVSETDYLTAPASTKYHGAYEGGLFDHSLCVARVLQDLTEKLNLHWKDYKSPYRIGLFHDWCKVGQYKYDMEARRYQWDDSSIIKGHGTKSAILVQQFLSLNPEEVACIVYHMGSFVPEKEWNDYTNAIHRYPNVLWTHVADMYSSHVLEVM